MSKKTAAVLLIGDELLSGRTTDKNLSVIAQKLGERGITIIEARVLPDDADIITKTVADFAKRVDYVLTTGGIGPTHDDITAECIARAFNVPCVPHPDAVEILKNYYKPEDLNAARLSMANMPQGASLIPNPATGAAGFFMENVFVMAGVPKIMQMMLDFAVNIMAGGDIIHSETITTDMPEGKIADTLSAVQDRYPTIKIGSYPHYGEHKNNVSLVLRSTNKMLLAEATEALRHDLDALSRSL